MVRYSAIDSFRFIAAIGVVVLHFALYTNSAALNYAVEKSYLFVDLFFCVSGFVLYGTYAAGLKNFRHYLAFLQRRLARVYPLHLVTFAFYLAIALSAWHGGLQVEATEKYDASAIVPNLLLVHAWGTTKELSFNYPSWSISAEWFVYLAFPLVLWLAGRGGARTLLIVAIACVLALEMLTQMGVLPRWTLLTYDFGAARAVPSFLVGAALSRIIEAGQWRLKSFRPAIACFAAAIAAMGLHVDDSLIALILFATVATAAAAEAGGALGFLTNPVMARLGTWSYALYMLHPIVATLFIREIGLDILGIHGDAATIAWCLLVLLIAVAFSGIVHSVFEAPARHLFRDWRWKRKDLGPLVPEAADLARPRAQNDALASVDTITIGGLPIACLDLQQTSALMIDLVREKKRGDRPYYFTSANGEVTARCRSDAQLRRLVTSADLISADGQPLVFASRLFCRKPLPERAATTDLFDLAAAMAEKSGVSFYLFGATQDVNERAYERTRRLFPDLEIVGHSHGYLKGEALEAKIDEINALAPGILWLGLGVPREQAFAVERMNRLANVGLIKTSGGLFDFMSGRNRRAPKWIQAIGFEWAFRIWLEPRRLLWRYVVTNPVAVLTMILQSN